ncbi:MAG: divalent-cation tolerance protein CutA [Alphaproteobacteria bacterium]
MPANAEFCFLYSTFPDGQAALSAARVLIDTRLAACVNIYPPMTSVYEWQGKREETREVAMFVKTRRARFEDVAAALRPLHPYTTPCFLMLPIEGGNPDYLAWAREQTKTI